MKQAAARKDYIDVARGLGIILVVLGHALEATFDTRLGGHSASGIATFALWKFIYSFHMPFFFVLSGVAMPRLAELKLGKVLSGVLCLIFLAAALQFVFAPARLAWPRPGDALPRSLAGDIGYVFWPALKLESYALVVVWFLPCLALVRLAAWLVGNASRRGAVTWLAALAGLCLMSQAFNVGYFQLRTVLVGMALFWVGQCIGALAPERLPRSTCWLVCLAGLLVTTLTFGANHGCSVDLTRVCKIPGHDAFAVIMASGTFGFLPLFALTSLSGSIAVLAASILLAHSKAVGWIIVIGRRTLELLIVNGVVLVFLEPRLGESISSLPPPLIVAPLVLAQLVIALASHPVLSGFLALVERAAQWATRILLRYMPTRAASDPNGVPT